MEPLSEAPRLPLMLEPPELWFEFGLLPLLRTGTNRLPSRLTPLSSWFWPPSALLMSLLRMPLSTPQSSPLPPVLSPPVPPLAEALPPLPPWDDACALPP